MLEGYERVVYGVANQHDEEVKGEWGSADIGPQE